MTTPSTGPSGFDDSETSYGGADAVEKTTYVTGEGTNPRAPDPLAAEPNVRNGMSPLLWAVIAIAVIIALVYAVWVFR